MTIVRFRNWQHIPCIIEHTAVFALDWHASLCVVASNNTALTCGALDLLIGNIPVPGRCAHVVCEHKSLAVEAIIGVWNGQESASGIVHSSLLAILWHTGGRVVVLNHASLSLRALDQFNGNDPISGSGTFIMDLHECLAVVTVVGTGRRNPAS